MPIKKWTDGSQQVRLPVIADIRKGAPQTERRGKPMVGKDLDFFRVEFRPGFEHLESDFRMLFGDEPSHIRTLMLMGREVDDVFDSWLDMFANGKLIGRSDGEHILMLWDFDRNEWDRQPKPYDESQWLDKKGNPRFQPRGYIQFFCKKLAQRTGVMGAMLWRISSKYEITRVYNALVAAHAMAGTVGHPLEYKLSRHSEQILVPGEEGRMNVEKSMVKLTCTNLMDHAMNTPRLAAPADETLLDAGNEYYVDDDGVVYEDVEHPFDTGEAGSVEPPPQMADWKLSFFMDTMPSNAETLKKFTAQCAALGASKDDIMMALENGLPKTGGRVEKIGENGYTKAQALASVMAFMADYDETGLEELLADFPEFDWMKGETLKFMGHAEPE